MLNQGMLNFIFFYLENRLGTSSFQSYILVVDKEFHSLIREALNWRHKFRQFYQRETKNT